MFGKMLLKAAVAVMDAQPDKKETKENESDSFDKFFEPGSAEWVTNTRNK